MVIVISNENSVFTDNYDTKINESDKIWLLNLADISWN